MHTEAWIQGHWDRFSGRAFNPNKYDLSEYRAGWLSVRW